MFTQDEYESLWACYRSGQMSEAQWQEHLKDSDFADWVAKKQHGLSPDAGEGEV